MCQLLWSKSVATKESLLQSILEEFRCICKVHVENVCMYWHALLIYICTVHILDAYSDILNTYAPWVCWYSIWLWHMQHPCCLYHKELLRHQYLLEDCYLYGIDILYTIPRTITSWSTETLLCPCMFLICPYFAPHPLACSYFVSSPSPVSPYCTPPCLPLVIFHVCP